MQKSALQLFDQVRYDDTIKTSIGSVQTGDDELLVAGNKPYMPKAN